MSAAVAKTFHGWLFIKLFGKKKKKKKKKESRFWDDTNYNVIYEKIWALFAYLSGRDNENFKKNKTKICSSDAVVGAAIF